MMKSLIAKTYKSLFKDHGVFELRVPKTSRGTVSGFFGAGGGTSFLKAVQELDGNVPSIYITLNPVKPELLDRIKNKTIDYADRNLLTKDEDIERRALILVDVDPKRPADCASTDDEKKESYDVAMRIRDEMSSAGFPLPFVADSGNGFHLLYKCDLQNTSEVNDAVKGFLKYLHAKFSTDIAHVDVKVSNASRIVKLYGTMSTKGDNSPDRPHRRSELLECHQDAGFVTMDMLMAHQFVESVVERVKKQQTETHANTGTPNRKYVLSALDSAIQKVQNAPPGQRNDTLNSEAFCIAQFVGGGELNESLAWNALSEAAEINGLQTSEIDSTLHSAFNKGKLQPRKAPEVKQRAVAAQTVSRVPETIDPDTGEIIEHNHGDPVDWYSPLPDVNGKGKPQSTISNVAAAAHRLGVTIRYNIIKKKREIIIPNQSFSMDNEAEAAFAWFTSSCKKFELPTAELDAYTWYIADSNIYNPVTTWVTSKPWDGVSRIGDFHNTVTAANQDSDQKIKRLKETMMTKWLLSAIAAAFEPNGASTAGVLVFTGAQYMGKTKWFKSLTPKSLDVTKDGLSLRPDDRDSVKRAVSYWMVELGELDATFRKADIAALKAFITSDRDVMRLSYGREERTFARRTVFFGSVNDDQFLKDKTGNRRFWTINCQAIDCDHKIDMQQLWAEVYESMYLKGMSWFLSNQEVADLNEHNDNHTEIDPIDERLSFRLDWKTDQSNWRWVTATQMLMECGIDRPTSSDTKTAGVFLRKMNVQKRKSSGKSLVCVPPALKIGQF
jgi:hypothetical protein